MTFALIAPSPARQRRHFLQQTAVATLGAATWGCAPLAYAVGRRVDVTVIDRDSGETLMVHPHHGQRYIAGRPGARYAIRLANRTGGRLLAVVSVDGVNVVTGQTAAWHQAGYVLAPWQVHDIAGWRKNDREVASFEFTTLPDAYAARTGRPHDVGVIGVAVFAERPVPPPMPEPAEISRSEPRRAPARDAGAAAKAAPERPATAQAAERLGTGHGAREPSEVTSTRFERSSNRPLELVSLQYDRHENLVRAGVIPHARPVEPGPRPFPHSAPDAGYVPDPPAR